MTSRIVIAGAGIGGLATALSLEAAGFTDIRVLEAAALIRQVGVGVNLPPHAVRELTWSLARNAGIDAVLAAYEGERLAGIDGETLNARDSWSVPSPIPTQP